MIGTHNLVFTLLAVIIILITITQTFALPAPNSEVKLIERGRRFATQADSIDLQSSSSGRVIGYLIGWAPPPPAAELASAGYTHLMVSFGVFSKSAPGQIIGDAFSSISATYVAQCQAAGMKVILALGGASTGVAGSSVDFEEVIYFYLQYCRN